MDRIIYIEEGKVDDVQVNGTSVLNATTKVANITDSALSQVKYTAQTLTDEQKLQALINIGAITLKPYDSSATEFEDGVLYYTATSAGDYVDEITKLYIKKTT